MGMERGRGAASHEEPSVRIPVSGQLEDGRWVYILFGPSFGEVEGEGGEGGKIHLHCFEARKTQVMGV